MVKFKPSGSSVDVGVAAGNIVLDVVDDIVLVVRVVGIIVVVVVGAIVTVVVGSGHVQFDSSEPCMCRFSTASMIAQIEAIIILFFQKPQSVALG